MINKVIQQQLVDLYVSGLSLTQVSKQTSIPISTVRHHVKAAGALRTRADGVRLAHQQGRVPKRKTGQWKPSPETRARMTAAAQERGEVSGKGWTITSQGYVALTRGPNKGQLLHRVVAAELLGRALRPDEVVHHIDRDRTNNNPWNLQVMTRSEHAALHRRERC